MFLNALHKAAPFKITTLLSDNGREFTDRAFGRREKDASGTHEFDALFEALAIEHRLMRPKHPQTNGIVERFNGRLSQLLKSHRFDSAHDLQTTLHRFVWLYNQHLPQRSLNAATPVQSLKQWQASHPHLFSKRVVNHPGPDSPTEPPGSPRRERPLCGSSCTAGQVESGLIHVAHLAQHLVTQQSARDWWICEAAFARGRCIHTLRGTTVAKRWGDARRGDF